jgi:phenylpropionate dioxygenase-like ring-hydroxylating dioxygenase large terminal subunit
LPDTHYLDNRIFTDPELFEEERRKIFEKGWNFVCHESEVAAPGDYRAVNVAGHPIIVVRERDQSIRAIHNSCPHRGQKIVRKECGNARSFQCFYHLWNFGLDGRLRQVTRPSGYDGTGFQLKDFCVPQVRVETMCGLIFVCLDSEAQSLEQYLGDVVPNFREVLGAVPMEVFIFHQAVFKTNWKLWNDNNSELYHEYMHYLNRNTNLKGTSFFDRTWRLYPNGHNHVPEAVVDYASGGLGERSDCRLPGTKPNGFCLTNIFPDTVINCRSTIIRMDRMVPLEPGRTLIEWRGIGVKGEPPKVRAMRERHFFEIWGPCGRNITEDQIAVETQWQTMASGSAPYTVLARDENLKPMTDGNLRAYYQEWSRRMGRAAHDPFGELAQGARHGTAVATAE